MYLLVLNRNADTCNVTSKFYDDFIKDIKNNSLFTTVKITCEQATGIKFVYMIPWFY